MHCDHCENTGKYTYNYKYNIYNYKLCLRHIHYIKVFDIKSEVNNIPPGEHPHFCVLFYVYILLLIFVLKVNSEIKNYDYACTRVEYYLTILRIAMQISYEISRCQIKT